ncbi:MAG: hypothetical protein AAF235_05255 [Planctomycetota bacterium]
MNTAQLASSTLNPLAETGTSPPTPQDGSVMTRRQAMIDEARYGRDRAERLLRSLIDARTSAGRGLSLMKRPDLVRDMPKVDSAVEGVQELIETYSRMVDELLLELTDEDLDLIELANEAERRDRLSEAA